MNLLNKIFKRNEKKIIARKIKVGIVFGGGGARGFGHIGAVKAFEEVGIKPDYICGTSIGSLIGAAWASGAQSKHMETIAKALRTKDIKPSKILPTPSSTSQIEELAIKAMQGDKLFSELKIPFGAVAVDIKTGEEVLFESGFVAKSVAASCCAPVVFTPVEIDGRWFVDGGLLNNLPTSVAKAKFCDVIIAVDINSSRGAGSETTKLFDVIGATIRIMGAVNAKLGYRNADIVITPDLKRFKSLQILEGHGEEMIEEGYRATMEKMPEILKLIKNAKPIKQRIKAEIKRKKAELYKDIKEYNKVRAEELRIENF